MKRTHLILTILIGIAFIFPGCDKHIPPDIHFKTDTGYTFSDATVAQGTTIKVGIIGIKKEDPMRTFNISYAYDGAATTTTKETFKLSGSEQTNYDKDYEFTVRNQAGTEKWTFVITDKDGNIAKLSLNLTVQ
jgi:hypothetical protein